MLWRQPIPIGPKLLSLSLSLSLGAHTDKHQLFSLPQVHAPLFSLSYVRAHTNTKANYIAATKHYFLHYIFQRFLNTTLNYNILKLYIYIFITIIKETIWSFHDFLCRFFLEVVSLSTMKGVK